MAVDKINKITWWQVSKFKQVGAQKLPLWHALIYFVLAVTTWASVAFIFATPKLLPKEFGESLSIGFVFTFYGFILYSFGCFRDSYQLVKSNNLARYFIIWLGCWSAMGLRMVTLGVLPLVVVMGLSSSHPKT